MAASDHGWEHSEVNRALERLHHLAGPTGDIGVFQDLTKIQDPADLKRLLLESTAKPDELPKNPEQGEEAHLMSDHDDLTARSHCSVAECWHGSG